MCSTLPRASGIIYYRYLLILLLPLPVAIYCACVEASMCCLLLGWVIRMWSARPIGQRSRLPMPNLHCLFCTEIVHSLAA